MICKNMKKYDLFAEVKMILFLLLANIDGSQCWRALSIVQVIEF